MAGATLYDVARLAGVSQPTASRVLNGSARTPGAEVVSRVRLAAAELGYVAHAQAQALARSASGLVGLVVHDITDPYFSAIARGVQDLARTQGRQVLLASTDRDPDREREALGAFLSHRADAVILAGSRRSRTDDLRLREDIGRYLSGGGRLAVIGQPWSGVRAVVPANRAGAKELAGALVALGHRRFAILAGPGRLRTAADRAAGFAEGVTEAGLAAPSSIPGDFTRDGGYASAGRLLAEHSDAAGGGWCVFAVNDVMAIGALVAFREAGLRVPRDIAVAGFDDIPTLRDFTPALTTVALPLARMGEQALELALADSAAPTAVQRVPGIPRLRESTARKG